MRLLKFVTGVFFCLPIHYNLIGQCTGETSTIVNQCLNQQAQVSVSPIGSGIDYKWYLSGSLYGSGSNFTFPNPLSGTATVNYQKEITTTGGPSAGSGTYSVPAGTTVESPNYTVNVNSTSSFVLNKLTIPIQFYYCDPASTYRIKVIVGPLATPTDASIWYTFKCSDLIATSNSQIFLLKMPVNKSTTTTGLTIPSGATSISVITDDPATNPSGTINIIGGLVKFSTTTFNNTYTFGNTTITHSSTTNRPAFLDWNITTLCSPVAVTVNSSNGTGCCVPSNVSTPSITSSSGTSIIDTDPVSPAITLSTPLQSGYYYQWYKNNTAIGSLTVNANTLSVTTGGTYTVRVVEKTTDISKTACYKEAILAVSKRILFAETDKTSLCIGETAQLNAKGATGINPGDILWSPSTGINNTGIKTPTFTPSAAGNYTINVKAQVPIGNQIINGDFESSTASNAGFNYSPYYLYQDPSTAVVGTGNATDFGITNRLGLQWLQNGRFSIYNYVFDNNDGYVGIKPCRDHTTGSGNLLFTDAASKNVSGSVPLTDSYLFSQMVTLQAGQTYEFTSWFANTNSETCGCTDPFDNQTYAPKTPSGQPQINFYVNDVAINPTPITISGATCQWQKVSYTYTAPSSGTATIKVVEVSRADAGNDFAMDDISFGAPGDQTSSVTINVTDCNTLTASYGACSGTNAPITATTNGTFIGWTPTTGIANPASATTTIANPSGSSITATAKFNLGNLITNGDFSAGSGGNASTDFAFNGYNVNTNQYTIINALTTSNTTYGYVQPTGNGGTGGFLVANTSAGTAGLAIWKQNVNITSTGEHMFSFNIANVASKLVSGSAVPNVQIKIGTTTCTVTTRTDSAWTQVYCLYNATSTGSLTLQIIDNYIGSGLNGVALDNLVFAPTITKTANVTPVSCLPLNFISFVYDENNLTWIINNENHFKYFEIESSIDCIYYKTEKIVLATTSLKYNYLPQLKDLKKYYRIKGVTYNESVEYSNALVIQKDNSEFAIYPNPSNTNFTLQSSSENDEIFELNVINVVGDILITETLLGNNTFSFGDKLNAGSYFITIKTPNSIFHKKIIKQ